MDKVKMMNLGNKGAMEDATAMVYRLLKPIADKAVEQAIHEADKAGEGFAVVINPAVVCAQFSLMLANNFIYHGVSEFALGLIESEQEMNNLDVTEEMFTQALFLMLDQHIHALQHITENGLESCRDLVKRSIHARTCKTCRLELEDEHFTREYRIREH